MDGSWNEWELRVLVIISFVLQMLLMLIANLRKRKSSQTSNIVIWLAYLLADNVAFLALGFLSKVQRGFDEHHSHPLAAFWAPFLLLHIAGHGTISAFSLEDNQLWLRHGFGVGIQVSMAGYISLWSFKDHILLLPSILVFLVGSFKCAERTWALRSGSTDGLRSFIMGKPDPGPKYANLVEKWEATLRSGRPVDFIIDRDLLQHNVPAHSSRHPQVRILLEAHHFFKKFKGLFVDAIFTFKDRNESQSFFARKTHQEAFTIIDIELSFVYDVLYTKAFVSRTTLGWIIRSMSLLSTSGALVFFFVVDVHGLLKENVKVDMNVDVAITYTLLVGAVVLEVLALAPLVFSYWTIVQMRNQQICKWLEGVILRLNPLETPEWSNSMAQYNLLSFCLKDRKSNFKKFLELLGAKEVWDNYWHTRHVPVSNELKSFVFEDLRAKSNIASESNDYQRFTLLRGNQALEQGDYNNLLWSVDMEFDESLLIWHIATDLCHHGDNSTSTHEPLKKLEMTKYLSDYLLYLLVVQPVMLSSVAVIGLKRYGDTCAEATDFFLDRNLEDEQEARTSLMLINTEPDPQELKGDESKSVLWYGCRLAKQLKRLSIEERWEIMFQVWVEMLSYAAIHCKANYHAQRLTTGGELLTFVWLLMIHLGMGQHFKIETGHAMASIGLQGSP